MRTSEMLRPLRQTAFRNQFLAQSISMFGSALAPTALAFGVLDATGSATDLGLVLAAYSLPMLLFALAGGVWADRIARQRLMMLADAAQCVAQCAFGVLIIVGQAQLWLMIVLQAVTGTATAFNMPAARGLTVDTTRPEDLQKANALLSLTRNLSNTIGPLLAGLLVTTVGAGWAIVVDGLTFAGSMLFLALLRVPSQARREQRPGFVAELRDGWHEVSQRAWVWVSIVYFMIFNLVLAAFLVLGPVSLADKTYGALGWGAVAGALAVGQAIGNSLALRFAPRRPLLVSRFVELLAVPVVVALGFGFAVPVLVVTALLMGISISFPDAIWVTALQQHTPEKSISRVMAFDLLGSFILRPVSFTIAATAASAFGTSWSLIAGAILMASATLGTLLVPGVRNLTDAKAPTEAGAVAPPSPA